ETVTGGRGWPLLSILSAVRDVFAHLLARSFRHVDVLDHLAVHETDHPLTVGGAHGVVRDHEDGDAELIAAASKKPHDPVTRCGVEVARRFIGQDDTRAPGGGT